VIVMADGDSGMCGLYPERKRNPKDLAEQISEGIE
jgi:hypothetical protein